MQNQNQFVILGIQANESCGFGHFLFPRNEWGFAGARIDLYGTAITDIGIMVSEGENLVEVNVDEETKMRAITAVFLSVKTALEQEFKTNKAKWDGPERTYLEGIFAAIERRQTKQKMAE